MIVVYGKPKCNYCDMAKQLLEAKSIGFKYIDVEEDDDALAFIVSSGHKTVPQIFEGDKHIGGYTELDHYIKHIRM